MKNKPRTNKQMETTFVYVSKQLTNFINKLITKINDEKLTSFKLTAHKFDSDGFVFEVIINTECYRISVLKNTISISINFAGKLTETELLIYKFLVELKLRIEKDFKYDSVLCAVNIKFENYTYKQITDFLLLNGYKYDVFYLSDSEFNNNVGIEFFGREIKLIEKTEDFSVDKKFILPEVLYHINSLNNFKGL